MFDHFPDSDQTYFQIFFVSNFLLTPKRSAKTNYMIKYLRNVNLLRQALFFVVASKHVYLSLAKGIHQKLCLSSFSIHYLHLNSCISRPNVYALTINHQTSLSPPPPHIQRKHSRKDARERAKWHGKQEREKKPKLYTP